MLKLYWIWPQCCFTRDTPKVFCGLKHLTHTSFSIVVSR